jgi:hypothetical protein
LDLLSSKCARAHLLSSRISRTLSIESETGPVLPPSQLPQCDVLQLDCEGAEAEILRELTIQPRVVLVETHGLYGAPTDLIASLLKKRGYVVSDRGLAEPNLIDHCTRNDIRVLLGTK